MNIAIIHNLYHLSTFTKKAAHQSSPKKYLIQRLIGFSLVLPGVCSAAFELNFLPHSNATASGTMLDTMTWSGPVGVVNGTPFLTYKAGSFLEIPEVVYIDGDNDNTPEPYYHMIVGSLADGFIQESYIRAGYSMRSDGDFINIHEPPGTGIADGGYASASAGDYTVTFRGPVLSDAANGSNPLAEYNISGNGSAHPGRVVVHQIVTDGQMFSYFKKSKLAYKPYIYQEIDVFGSINMVFEMDMSNSTYDDNSIAGNIKQNTLKLFGDNLPGPTFAGIPDATNWDMSTDSKDSFVTGGRYIYSEGSYVLDSPGGSEGDYIYFDGGFDHKSVNWEGYFDEYDATGNPWATESAKPIP